MAGFLTRQVDNLAWLLSGEQEENNRWLSGVYEPVPELEGALECTVVGKIPDGVKGMFLRNGPNPALPPSGGYHFFDGDGMVHAVRFKPGAKPMYARHLVKTVKVQEEIRVGYPVYLNVGSLQSKAKVLFQFLLEWAKTAIASHPKAEGAANTSLQYHAGRLWALHEGAPPHALRILCEGVLETLGTTKLGGKVEKFTAHPKTDPATGIMYAFGYQVERPPYMTIHVISPTMELIRSMDIEIEKGIMMHDAGITESFMVILNLPLAFRPDLMPNIFILEKETPAKFGLLPLGAESGSEVEWYTLPETVGCFHIMNAWDAEKDASGNVTKVSLVICQFSEFAFDKLEQLKITPWMYTINLQTREVTGEVLLPESVNSEYQMDFPHVRTSLTGRKTKYGYIMADTGSNTPEMERRLAIVKADLSATSADKRLAGLIKLEEGMRAGEWLFVPRNPDDKRAKEDDGYLMTFCMGDARLGENLNSELRIYNAATMDSKPVAVVKIPARVPSGFHGLWIDEADLAKQSKETTLTQ